MRAHDVILLLVYAVALSAGQLLFKLAADGLVGKQLVELAPRLFTSPAFLAAGTLYALLTIYWTWLLGRVPLSLAYPFVALCFVLVPFFSWLLFDERINLAYMIGLAFIVGGVVIIHAGQ